jgi:hypothetical protein
MRATPEEPRRYAEEPEEPEELPRYAEAVREPNSPTTD